MHVCGIALKTKEKSSGGTERTGLCINTRLEVFDPGVTNTGVGAGASSAFTGEDNHQGAWDNKEDASPGMELELKHTKICQKGCKIAPHRQGKIKKNPRKDFLSNFFTQSHLYPNSKEQGSTGEYTDM